MTNNDVLRRIRYILDLNDDRMIEIFALTGTEVNREQVCNWLKKEDDPGRLECTHKQLALFLNGLIIDRRGRKDGPAPVAEEVLDNNIIFRKLKIAFELQSDDIIALLQSVNVTISKHELSAFFRNRGHKHYRICKDQILRNVLKGLEKKFR